MLIILAYDTGNIQIICTFLISNIFFTTPVYLLSLLQVGHHDDGGSILLPDHSPEVVHRLLFWP